MVTLFFVLSVVIGVCLGLFSYLQYVKLKQDETKSAAMFVVVALCVVLIVGCGIALYLYAPGLSYIGFIIGVCMSCAPYIKTQADLHPDTEEAGE